MTIFMLVVMCIVVVHTTSKFNLKTFLRSIRPTSIQIIAASLLGTVSSLGPVNILYAADGNVVENPAAQKAIENIERVMYSLKYIEDEIAIKSDPDAVVAQVKYLLSNNYFT
jgi:hypothetical protein